MAEEGLLFPGDFIANEEEFIPGSGTFAEAGKVMSETIGSVDKDVKAREARVKALTPAPQNTREGMVVAGRIEQARENVAFVSLFSFKEGNVRWIAPTDSAILRVANIKRSFVKDVRDEFLVGDIIRAKILRIEEQSIMLTTDDNNLGVIKAFCSRCRYPMQLHKGELECGQCGWHEGRKLADDYGSGVVVK